jgi:hypothetical protein
MAGRDDKTIRQYLGRKNARRNGFTNTDSKDAGFITSARHWRTSG